MVKYYPTPPIDWVSALEKIYAKQSEQLRRHHEQLRQRDQQMVTKAQNENITRVFEGLAGLSSTVSQAVTTVKANQEKRDKKDRTAFEVEFARQGFTSDQLRKANDLYKTKKIEAIDGDNDIIKAAGQAEAQGKPTLASFFYSLTARQRIWAQELIAKEMINTFLTWDKFEGHLTETNELNAYGKLSNSDKQIKFKDWSLDELKHLDLSNEFLAANVLGEVERKASTFSNLSSASNSVKFKEDSDLKFNTLIKIKATDNDPNSLGSALNIKHAERVKFFEANPEEGRTATQSATNYIVNRLEKLLLSSDPQAITLDNLNSYIDFGIDHPAGTTVGDVFISKEQINELVTAGKLGTANRAARVLAEVKSEAEELRTKALTPGSYESTADYHAEIDSLVGRGLSLEDAGKLKNINVFAQTADHFTSTMEEYTPIKIANSSLEEIDKIPNEPARKVIRRRKLQLIESEKMYGVSRGSMNSIIMNAPERAVPWKVGMEVKGTGVAGEIAMEIDNQGEALRAELVWAQYDEDGNLVNKNTEINTIVSTFKQNLWDSRGGGTTNKDGLYSINTVTNTFDNYIEQSRDISNLGKGSDFNTVNFNTWQVQADGYVGWTKESKTPMLTQEDVQHVFLTGDMTDRMEYLMSRFPEHKIEEVLQHSIDIYSKDEKSKGWVSRLGLIGGGKEDVLLKFKGRNEQKQKAKNLMVEGLDQMLDATLKNSPEYVDINTLKTLLNIQSWAYLDPMQKRRLLIYLSQNTEMKNRFDAILRMQDIVKGQENFEQGLDRIDQKSRTDETLNKTY